MAFRHIFLLTVLVVLAETSTGEDKKNCIKGKYEESLSETFTNCFNTKTSLFIPRVKQCYQDIMIDKRVVKVAPNGQMTVDRQKFGDYAQQNNHAVGKAMKSCYIDTAADDPMYQEAARASQCVFEKVKTTC